MTLKEAIERAEIMVTNRENRGYHQETGALKLLIGAGKRCLRYKAFHIGLKYEPLPGETKD